MTVLEHWQFLMPSNFLKNWYTEWFVLVSTIWQYADSWDFNIYSLWLHLAFISQCFYIALFILYDKSLHYFLKIITVF